MGNLRARFSLLFELRMVSLKGGKSYLQLRAGHIREDYTSVKSSTINIVVTFIIQFCSFLGTKVFPFIV